MIVEQLKQMVALIGQMFRSPLLLVSALVTVLLGLPTPVDIWFLFKLVPWSSMMMDFIFLTRLDNIPFIGFLFLLIPPPTTRVNVIFDAMVAQLDLPVLIGFVATLALLGLLMQAALIHFTYEVLFGKPAASGGVFKVIWQRLFEFGKLIGLATLALPLLLGFFSLVVMLLALFLPEKFIMTLIWIMAALVLMALVALVNMSARALLFNFDAKNAAKDHSYTATEQTSYGTSTYSYQNVRHSGYGEIDRLIDLGLKILRENFKLTLLVFALSWIVDLLKLIAAANGLLPYGWMLLYVILFGRGLELSSMTLIYSAIFIVISSLFVAWQAMLWTHLHFTKKAKDTKPAPEKQS